MTKDYEVGYGKPPQATQFTKGKSGNPRGKPKNSWKKVHSHPKHDLLEELRASLVVTEGGKKITVTKQKLWVKALLNSAIKGEKKAYDSVLKILGMDAPPIVDERVLRRQMKEELVQEQVAKDLHLFLTDDSIFEVDESEQPDGGGILESKGNPNENEN